MLIIAYEWTTVLKLTRYSLLRNEVRSTPSAVGKTCMNACYCVKDNFLNIRFSCNPS